MKKLSLISILSAFLLLNNAYSQGIPSHRCGSDEHYLEAIKKDKNFVLKQKIIEKYTREFVKRGGSKSVYSRSINTIVTIPVIVHVLWNQPIEQISMAQVESQIEVLNQDFQLLNADATSTPDPFKPLQADCKIGFCLAKIAPDGSPTTGVVYKHTDKTWFWMQTNEAMFSFLGGDDIWDRDNYLNIWVVPKIKNDSFQDDILGYAQFPGGAEETDGIVIKYSNFGTMGTSASPYNLGRITTHEVGHWLNLRHIWGTGLNIDPCLDSDEVDDTPNQEKSNHHCPSFPHITCNNIPNGDMFMNYMDYTYDHCRILFSLGQKDRMLALVQPNGDRQSLLSSQACTGIADLIVLKTNNLPIYANNGEDISLEFFEKNIGSESSGPNFVNFYLSEDNILTPGLNGDIYVNQFEVSNSIPPFSQSALLSKTLQIPNNLNPGIYYIFLVADAANNITEYNENNNFATNVLLISGTPPSPTQTAYRYWFDNGFNHLINVNLPQGNTEYNIQPNISSALLSSGLHFYNFQFKNNNNKWSSVSNSFFYKNLSDYPGGNAKYQFWFDNNIDLGATKTISSDDNYDLQTNLNTSIFSLGLHTFNIRFKPTGKQWSSVSSSFFYNPEERLQGPYKYEYWYDNNYESKVSVEYAGISNFILMDSLLPETLAEGLHTFNIRFKPDNKTWSSVSSTFFYKSSSIPNETPEYQYWLDNDFDSEITTEIGSTNNFILFNQLDFGELSDGLHVLHFRSKINGTTWSSVSSSFFVKDNKLSDSKLTKCIYWFNDNWSNYYSILFTPSANINAIIQLNTDGLSSGDNTVSTIFQDDNGLWSSVVRDTFTKLENIIASCPDYQKFVSGLASPNNISYQWQVNSGSGFVNINNSAEYGGTNTDTLIVSNAPTGWYGYLYRCNVATNQGNVYSVPIPLRFIYFWKGTVDNNWETAGNWDCNLVPGTNADVIINSGNVIVNSNVIISSLTTSSLSDLKINQSNIFNLKGH